ncbi:MAG TPA: PA0069 family radical SAM protein [Planctomycetota bacterium]|nr:PA0069 family radical SAM protein [Planctomycetota bacterium]
MRLVSNPPNPWHSNYIEWIDCPPPAAQLEIYEEQAKTVLSENDSPDVGFRFSLNPYRGCFHACAYCYARPTHQYWDFGAGTDFERKIIVKTNAPEKLRETFMKKSWQGDLVVFSGNTDCYQPLEVSYTLTRRCLEVCYEFRNPVGLITKSALVRRDIDVLSKLARDARAGVHMSIAFADDAMARKIEPNAPAPSTRFAAIRALTEAGIPVGVAVAPIIPGLNDSQLAQILERAHENGAREAFRVMLRLPSQVKDVFFERLQQEYPDRVQKVTHAIREMRNGALYNSQFGERAHGVGERWNAIQWLFDTTCKRLGYNVSSENHWKWTTETTFRRPSAQLNLFE